MEQWQIHSMVAWLLFFLVSSRTTDASQLYNFYLLRNPGLIAAERTCFDGCIERCMTQSGCSAISYRQSNGTCLLSMCNNLDIVYVAFGDWITYIIGTPFIEYQNTRPIFEWMLTDTCGNSSQGYINGPVMQLFNTNYASSPSVSAGLAAKFTGAASSIGYTATSQLVNNPLANNSLAVMFWTCWDALKVDTTFMEFSQSNTLRGVHFWIHSGGFWVALGANSNCQGTCAGNLYPFAPTVGFWNHFAFVYDGGNSMLKIYLNFTLIGVYSSFTRNSITWDTVQIGNSLIDSNGAINGRIFCFKIFQLALTGAQIALFGDSCLSGKVRIS